MPVSTSPYLQNDYQSANTFRPYQLPVNDIAQSMHLQNAYWEEGALRVKNIYDNILNLKLSNPENIRIRDQFLKNAEKEINKLSSMNLADPSVQRKASSIFDPLYQDEGIMYDDQATRHIDKINSDALSFRSKDNGKYYSSVNHQYALMGAREFKDSQDRMAGKKYLQNAKNYEPFYDPSSELDNILKNCNPDSYSGDSVQGFYIQSISSETLNSRKISSCLDAGLSDKAKRQLQINGVVTYSNNLDALKDKYIPFVESTQKSLLTEKSAIEGVLANRSNLKNLKEDELKKLGIPDPSIITPDFIKMLEQRKSNIEVRISNLFNTINKLNYGDYSPISNENLEPIAGMIYMRDYMNNVGEGFSYDFQKNSLKEDSVQSMFYSQYMQNQRQEDSQKHELYMKQMEIDGNISSMLKNIKDGKLTNDEFSQFKVNNPLGAGAFSSVEKETPYEEISKKREDIKNKRVETNKWLYEQIGLPKELMPDGKWTEAAANWYQNYKISSKGDPIKESIISEYEKKMGILITNEDILRNIQDSVDQKVYKEVKPVDVSDIKSVVLNIDNKQVEVSPDTILNSINGKSKVFNFDTLDYSENSSFLKSPTINNKPIIGSENYRKINELFLKIKDRINNRNKKEKDLRYQFTNEEIVSERESYILPELNDSKKSFKKTLLQASGISDKYKDKLNVVDTDLKGNVIIQIDEKGNKEDDYDKDIIINNILNKYTSTRINDKGAEDPEGNRIMLKNISYLNVLDNESSLLNNLKPYIRQLENKTLQGKQSTPLYRGIKGSYRMEVSKGLNTPYNYKIYNSESSDPVTMYDDRQIALKAFEKLLSD